MKTKGNQKSRRKFIHNIATLTAGVTVGSSKLWGAPAYLPNLLQTNASKGVQVGRLPIPLDLWRTKALKPHCNIH